MSTEYHAHASHLVDIESVENGIVAVGEASTFLVLNEPLYHLTKTR